MSLGAKKQILYLVAAALRLLLFAAFPGLAKLLTGRVEVSTPVTSFKRCRSRDHEPWRIFVSTQMQIC